MIPGRCQVPAHLLPGKHLTPPSPSPPGPAIAVEGARGRPNPTLITWIRTRGISRDSTRLLLGEHLTPNSRSTPTPALAMERVRGRPKLTTVAWRDSGMVVKLTQCQDPAPYPHAGSSPIPMAKTTDTVGGCLEHTTVIGRRAIRLRRHHRHSQVHLQSGPLRFRNGAISLRGWHQHPWEA